MVGLKSQTFAPGKEPTLSPFKPFPPGLLPTITPYLTPGPGYTYPPGKVPPTRYPGEIIYLVELFLVDMYILVLVFCMVTELVLDLVEMFYMVTMLVFLLEIWLVVLCLVGMCMVKHMHQEKLQRYLHIKHLDQTCYQQLHLTLHQD
jgi:hypothetical protein